MLGRHCPSPLPTHFNSFCRLRRAVGHLYYRCLLLTRFHLGQSWRSSAVSCPTFRAQNVSYLEARSRNFQDLVSCAQVKTLQERQRMQDPKGGLMRRRLYSFSRVYVMSMFENSNHRFHLNSNIRFRTHFRLSVILTLIGHCHGTGFTLTVPGSSVITYGQNFRKFSRSKVVVQWLLQNKSKLLSIGISAARSLTSSYYSLRNMPRWRALNHFNQCLSISYTDGQKHEDLSKVLFILRRDHCLYIRSYRSLYLDVTMSLLKKNPGSAIFYIRDSMNIR